MTDLSPVDRSAERGVPSLVWRAGQERRLAMIEAASQDLLKEGCLLDVGCGVGMYLRAFHSFSPRVFGVEIEADRAREAVQHGLVAQSPGENLPFSSCVFDVVLSHEVIEHVSDDAAYVEECVRVLKVGGRLALFCPNRLYPFETHGHYWRGRYHFGNTPLINYLPNGLRNRLAPHVRAYTAGGLRGLFYGLPVNVVLHTQVFPGYDNMAARHPAVGKAIREVAYRLEQTPLRCFGLSHFLVVEKTSG